MDIALSKECARPTNTWVDVTILKAAVIAPETRLITPPDERHSASARPLRPWSATRESITARASVPPASHSSATTLAVCVTPTLVFTAQIARRSTASPSRSATNHVKSAPTAVHRLIDRAGHSMSSQVLAPVLVRTGSLCGIPTASTNARTAWSVP